jgi:exopolysaccharide production protein ExoZ
MAFRIERRGVQHHQGKQQVGRVGRENLERRKSALSFKEDLVHGKKLISVQALRGIAVLLVLFFHLSEVRRHYFGELFSSAFSSFGNAGVDLFFVISGFVVVGVARRIERSGVRAALEFMYDRAARIYPIYWIYSLVLIIPFLLNPALVNSLTRMHGAGDYLRSFLLLPNATSPVLLVGWTLVFEVYFYVVLAAMLLLRVPIAAALVGWTGALIACNVIWTSAGALTKPVLALVSSPLSLEFVMGAAVSYALLRPLRRRGAGLLVVLAIMLVSVLCFTLDLPREDIDPWFRTLVYGPIGVILLIGTVSLEEYFHSRYFAWLVAIGDASYSIYLSHTLILSGAGRLLGASPLRVWGTAASIALAAACLILGHWSYKYLETPLLRRSRGLKHTLFQPSAGRST